MSLSASGGLSFADVAKFDQELLRLLEAAKKASSIPSTGDARTFVDSNPQLAKEQAVSSIEELRQALHTAVPELTETPEPSAQKTL